VLLRSQKLRLAGSLISADGFERRKHFFNDTKHGIFHSLDEEDSKPPSPGLDQMGTMMTRYMQMLGPQILQMAWISYFFSGFVLGRLLWTRFHVCR
jgi:Integral membrane protein EMC3/TMCO1-like